MRSSAEAIDVIRAFARAGTTDYGGDFYRLNGASPGPHPQADIPLWIGGYRPRILQLIGEKGDGWVFSDMFLPPANIAEGNRRIDEAASAAGRNPADIRRLYNISGSFQSGTAGNGFLQGSATVWAEQLTELALTDGVSGFILAPRDDPAEQLRVFAREVAPPCGRPSRRPAPTRQARLRGRLIFVDQPMQHVAASLFVVENSGFPDMAGVARGGGSNGCTETASCCSECNRPHSPYPDRHCG